MSTTYFIAIAGVGVFVVVTLAVMMFASIVLSGSTAPSDSPDLEVLDDLPALAEFRRDHVTAGPSDEDPSLVGMAS